MYSLLFSVNTGTSRRATGLTVCKRPGIKICKVDSEGKEKGYFQYGGSTIIVLIEPEQVQIREDILQSSALAKEVPVKMGEVIGHALEHKRTIQ